MQYWVTADKEILKARLTTSFKMATNRWVKRKWVRNQLYKRTDHLYLSGQDETFSVRFVGGTPGEEAGSNKDDPADEHWFGFNRGELTVMHILQKKYSWKRVSCCRCFRSPVVVSSSLGFCQALFTLWMSVSSPLVDLSKSVIFIVDSFENQVEAFIRQG